MPSLPSDESTDSFHTSNLLIRCPLLIFRLVLLALLINFALLSLIFASWNINATLSIGQSAPATPALIILESCLVFLCGGLALVDFFCPSLKSSRIIWECVWVGFLSVFKAALAISATVNGPAAGACSSTYDWNTCASSTLLVPSTWLSTMLSLTYFLVLFIATMAHKSLYPQIWQRSVYAVEWFGTRPEPPMKERTAVDFFGQRSKTENPYPAYYDDIESTPGRKKRYATPDSVEDSAPWIANVRRGIDHPFTRPSPPTSSQSSPVPTKVALPALPKKSTGGAGSGSRFVEKFRESTILARSETSAQFGAHYHARERSFPPTVPDLDLPVPLTRLSEWVRADEMRGITVHSKPHLLRTP